jgi:hypothetical protein
MFNAGYEAFRNQMGAAYKQDCGFRSEICSAYAEAVSCAGTGTAPCLFLFYKSNQAVAITTTGEPLDRLVVSNVRTMSKGEAAGLAR